MGMAFKETIMLDCFREVKCQQGFTAGIIYYGAFKRYSLCRVYGEGGRGALKANENEQWGEWVVESVSTFAL